MKNARISVLQERLAKAVAYLELLDVERISHGEPNLGKSIEERIIWRELLDLELQEFEEEIERLAEAAHSLVADVGTATQAGSETQQQPQDLAAPSSWWRLGRLFR
jgi:hypothetical protein